MRTPCWFLILAACSSAPPAQTSPPPVRPERGGEAAESKDASVPPAPDAAPPRELAYAPVPFTEPRTAKLGKGTITITPCRLDVAIDADPEGKNDAGGLAVDTEGRIYVLRADGAVRRFTLSAPCDLRVDDTFAPITITARDKADSLSIDAAGILYATRFNEKPIRIVPGSAQEEICSHIDVVRTEPGAAVTVVDGKAVTSLTGECDGPEVTLAGWKGYTPENVWPFAGDHAFINYLGDSIPIDYQQIMIHSTDGKKKVWVGSAKRGPQQICGVNVVWPCGKNICAGDWGCSSLRVWKLDGKFVGEVQSPELVGLVDARPIDAVVVGDASLMLIKASVADEAYTTWTSYPLIVKIEGL